MRRKNSPSEKKSLLVCKTNLHYVHKKFLKKWNRCFWQWQVLKMPWACIREWYGRHSNRRVHFTDTAKNQKSQACFSRKKALVVAELNALQCASLKYLEVVLGICQCSVTKLLSLFFYGLGQNLPELAPSSAVDQPELNQKKTEKFISYIIGSSNNMCGNIWMYYCLGTIW